jgi:hypothetical protein
VAAAAADSTAAAVVADSTAAAVVGMAAADIGSPQVI